MSYGSLQIFRQTVEEVHTHLYLLQHLSLLLLGISQFLAQEIPAYQPCHKHDECRDIEELAPEGEIPRRQDGDVERINLGSYLAFTIHGMNRKMIIAIRQTIISDIDVAGVQIMPIVIAAFEFVSING